MKENIKQQLEVKLCSAFRKGASAFRHGLVTRGYSDHLPIKVSFNDGKYNAVSWNMLADQHLWNNFRNVSGIHLVDQLLKDNGFDKENPYLQRANSYHFYVEFAKYLYEMHSQEFIEFSFAPDYVPPIAITPELLRNFGGYNLQDSIVGRSRDKAKAIEKKKRIRDARACLMHEFERALFGRESDLKQDIGVSIQHALELIYHIVHDQGALRWKNRLGLLKNNRALCKQLATSDFLCLQECTSPEDMQQLLTHHGAEGVRYSHIKHSKSGSNDHCVIVYNDTKFDLIGTPITGAIGGKKPYIMARFRDKETGEEFIISSIHHPGGGHSYDVPELLEQQAILDNDGKTRYYMMGDFNNTEAYYNQVDKENKGDFKMHFPTKEGTLAGSDFGNVNQAIDGVFTNDFTRKVTVSVVDLGRISSPAKTPFRPSFASARFFPSVTEVMMSQESKCASAEIDMGVSEAAKRAAPVDLNLLLKN